MSREQGQALVEFAIAAGVFALMLLGAVWLFRLHEIQRQGVMSARTAAFTAVWMKGRESTSVAQVRLRRFHFQQAGWIDPTGNEAMPSGEEAVTLRLVQGAPPGTAPAAVSIAMAPLRAVGGFLGSGFDLPMDRQTTATVDVIVDPVARLPEPMASLRLALSEHLSILGDSWGASGPREVSARTSGLVPTNLLRTPMQWLSPFLWPLSLIEPAVGRLCMGLIEPDRVPRDRLSPGMGGVPQPGEPGCH